MYSAVYTHLTNWSKTGRSPCYVYRPRDIDGIAAGLGEARARNLSVIPHGAGHSYTDAAWNTNGLVLDLAAMRRVIDWDPEQGIMRVEPGVTLRDMLHLAWKDGWWPFATPSTPDVTAGGCVAMNVMGKNAWRCGAFGDHLLAMEVLLASGEVVSLAPGPDGELFNALVGSLGLLGVVVSVTVQLQRLPSGQLEVERQNAATLDEIFTHWAELRQRSDFIEAWIDGFAVGQQLGRGQISSARISSAATAGSRRFPAWEHRASVDQLQSTLVSRAGPLFRPAFLPSVPLANRARYLAGQRRGTSRVRSSLPAFTYYPPAAFAGYHTMLPRGVETFQAFVPAAPARDAFEAVLRYSQEQDCFPIWCIIKEHRQDASLLSYQVDGFSLELNYPRTGRTQATLEPTLRAMIEMIIEAGGRFYPAKDHFQSREQYRRSMGDGVVDRFLELKARYDPEALWQSDLFARLFAR